MSLLHLIKKLKRYLQLGSILGFLGLLLAWFLKPEGMEAWYGFEIWVIVYLLTFWGGILILDLAREGFSKWGSWDKDAFRTEIKVFDRILMSSLWLFTVLVPLTFTGFSDALTFWLFAFILVLSPKDPKALHFDSEGIIAYSTWGKDTPWKDVDRIETEDKETKIHFHFREKGQLTYKIKPEESKVLMDLLKKHGKREGFTVK